MLRGRALAAMIAFEMQASPPPHRMPHHPLIAGKIMTGDGKGDGCVALLSASLPRLAGLQELHLSRKLMLHDEQRFWLCCLHVLLMLCIAL